MGKLKVDLVCPICGNTMFSISKGIRYCAPNFDEKQGCGWSGTREELILVGRTALDRRKLDFLAKYTSKNGDPWRTFWHWWWNNYYRADDGSNFEEGVQLALRAGLLRRK